MAKYVGIFLTPSSRRSLLKEFPPVHSNVYADHVTLLYEPSQAQLASVPLGEIAKFRVIGYSEDTKGQALRVAVPKEIPVEPGKALHVTISTAEGVPPSYAKSLVRKTSPAPGRTYTGIVDTSSRLHPVKTRFFPLAAERLVMAYLRQAKQVHTLYIFDFDGTLFKSPEPPDDYQGDWWSDTKTLNPPIVPKKPSGSLWNGKVVQALKRATSDPNGYTVVMTGRPTKFRRRISELLSTVSISPDELVLKEGGNVSSYKAQETAYLLKNFPTIRRVVLFEDNSTTIAALRKLTERLGLQYDGHLVPRATTKTGMDPEALVRRYLTGSHERSIALMKFLSRAAKKLGVAKHVYVVGGAVRNFVIDRPIKDIDVVIDAVSAGNDSEWFTQQLARMIPVPTNVTTNQYGVTILTVKGDWILDGENLQGEVIEIANARKESYGGDGGKGYKPTDVSPATIEEDVYRREFTFNTLMWRLLDLERGPEKAEIIDLTGCGLRDLNEMSIKCPRHPDVVFSDDPTRMLRAIKFTGKYGFKIPKDVVSAIKRNVSKMKSMPWEAIANILVNDILNLPTARKSLKQMKELGILDVVSEMIQNSKPFASFMARQLHQNRKVQFLLDLMDLGVPARTPLSFLDQAGRKRVRELTVSMPEAEAERFVDVLIKPPVDNNRLISVLDLPKQERRWIQPKARDLILQDPSLAKNPRKLTDLLIRSW